MFRRVAFSFDSHNSDHVKPLGLLINLHFKLSSTRGLLADLSESHVRHVFDHVKLRLDHVRLRVELPCSRATTPDR